MAEQEFSTAGLRPGEQFDVWGQVVHSVFAAASIHRLDTDESPSEFSSACQARRIGDLHLAWLEAAPHAVTRSAEHVGGVPGGVYFLSLTTRGDATSWQGGQVTHTRPGGLVIIDSDRPFELSFGSRLEQLCLTIPKSLLEPHLAVPQISHALALCTDTASGAVVAAALRALAGQRRAITARETRAVNDSLAVLIATAVSEATMARTDSHKDALIQAIIDEVDHGFADPGLTPAVVARRVAISVSYLTKLLHCRGTTFGHLLLARRLDHAWALLDPGLGHGRTVTSIATSCGFRDSAHFARSFRARFAVTPSERRSGLAAGVGVGPGAGGPGVDGAGLGGPGVGLAAAGGTRPGSP